MDWIERPMYLNGHFNSSTSQGWQSGRADRFTRINLAAQFI